MYARNEAVGHLDSEHEAARPAGPPFGVPQCRRKGVYHPEREINWSTALSKSSNQTGDSLAAEHGACRSQEFAAAIEESARIRRKGLLERRKVVFLQMRQELVEDDSDAGLTIGRRWHLGSIVRLHLATRALQCCFPRCGSELERRCGIVDRKSERVAERQQDAFACFERFECKQKRRRSAFGTVITRAGGGVRPRANWRGGISCFDRRGQPATDILPTFPLAQR